AVWLSPTQRADYMRKGLCFLCRKSRHHSGNHKKGKIPFGNNSQTPSPKVQKTETPPPSNSISIYAVELKKKKKSKEEILNILKICFD
ncbi:hypothetical protein PAXRUDRAFT_116668, partial [Paxillus rubicundulus Ve08.2h10]